MEIVIEGSNSNRAVNNNDGIGDWDAIHDAALGKNILDNYDSPWYLIFAGVSHTASLFIHRGYLFFNTLGVPDVAKIVSGTLSIFVDTVYHTASIVYPYLQVTEGVQDDPVVLNDYGDQLPYTTVLGQIRYHDLVTGQYNDITLNANGLALINKTGITKYCLRAELDVADNPPPLGTNLAYFHSAQKGNGYRPKLTIGYSGLAPFLYDKAYALSREEL